MIRSRIGRAQLLAALLATPSCQDHPPRPFDAPARLAAIDLERRSPSESPGSVTFAQAASWMLITGPDVLAAVAATQSAEALAGVPTPWSNPTIDVGPQYSFGTDARTRRWVPFLALNFTIPLAGVRDAQDAVLWLRAASARTEGWVRHRELWFTLRRHFVTALARADIAAAQRGLAGSLERSVASLRRLLDAGEATALDLALLELEHRRGLLEAELGAAERDAALAALADLVGISAERIPSLDPGDQPELPLELPSLPELKAGLETRHGALVQCAARYELAEALLRLELERQYPQLRLGSTGFGEGNERRDTLGLTVGVEIPLFDRNQQGIAAALAARDAEHSDFEASARRALSQVENAHRILATAQRQRRSREVDLLPVLEAAVALAERSTAAGAGDALRLLETQRAHERGRRELHEARLREISAWIDLEEASGLPLLRFRSEGALGSIPTRRELALPISDASRLLERTP